MQRCNYRVANKFIIEARVSIEVGARVRVKEIKAGVRVRVILGLIYIN